MSVLSKARETLRVLRGDTHSVAYWSQPDPALLPGQTASDAEAESAYEPPVTPENLVSVLSRYGLPGEFLDYKIGPQVTTYELEVPVGTKLSGLGRYADDMARDLGVPSVRFVHATRGSAVGVELENKSRFTVRFRELAMSMPSTMALPITMGEDTSGNASYYDLADMPHMLVARQTGSGKSVFMNACVASLICRHTPETLKLLIVDPKRVEFGAYKGLPHLQQVGSIKGIAYEPADAFTLLEWVVEEMDRRFGLLEEVGCRKISDYNKSAGEKLPYIVFVVDEFAELMLMGGKQAAKAVEAKVVRLAQKARAVGIHMILATQKPLVVVMTSLIKANMPARVAFSVGSSVDSRVILDECGAESLSGGGDYLFRDPQARGESRRIRRLQAPWLSDGDLRILLGKD
jgi:S-DNA-T family DNA segregation ATPase FtsK/SpoIIIE